MIGQWELESSVMSTPVQPLTLLVVAIAGWLQRDQQSCAFYLFIRVMEITDILSQNVPLEDVQYLAGHSNPSGHTDL